MSTPLIHRPYHLLNKVLESRYLSLLISLIAMILVPSLLENWEHQDIVGFVLRAATILLAIYTIQKSKFQLYIGYAIAAIIITLNQFSVFHEDVTFEFYLSFLIYLFFYGFVAYKLITVVLRTDIVSIGVLYASVIVYLLIAIIGGYLFMLIENALPGSINNLQLENLKDPSKFFYFSFITLSTLGYGDITPNSSAARAICMLLSTTGPLYLTILVALLVSRFDNNNKLDDDILKEVSE